MCSAPLRSCRCGGGSLPGGEAHLLRCCFRGREEEREIVRRTHYEELGISTSATQKQVERAFYLRRKGGGRAALSGRVDAAYAILSDPQRRRAYDRRIGCSPHPAWVDASPVEAKEVFERGLDLFRKGRCARALPYVRHAVALDPRKPLYGSYLALLIAVTGGNLRDAVRLGRRAWEHEPGSRPVAMNLAAVYEIAGLARRAGRIRRAARRSGPSGSRADGEGGL